MRTRHGVIATFVFLLWIARGAYADLLCRGGEVIWKNGWNVGCVFKTWGPGEELLCKGTVIRKGSGPGPSCNVCIKAEYADLSANHALRVDVTAAGAREADFSCLTGGFVSSSGYDLDITKLVPSGYTEATVCDCETGTWVGSIRACLAEELCVVPEIREAFVKGLHGQIYVGADRLYRASKGRNCRTVKGFWTAWLNRDNHSGTGDFETLKAFGELGSAGSSLPAFRCTKPVLIECATRSGVPWFESSRSYQCELPTGGVCDNRRQLGGASCLDYHVRIFCEYP